MRSRKYNPPNSAYHENCMVKGCNEVSRKCVCGQMGHPDFYKCSDTEIVPVVEHGHFLINHDTGRNVIHRYGPPITCPDEIKVTTWRTVRGYDRWLRMPDIIKEALGWD